MEKQRRTFLSYSRANKDFAVRLARELKAEGFPVWLDQLDIPPGSRWDVEVEKALVDCDIFMVIITQASSASENVLDEIGYAIDTGKRMLPVLLEKTNVPLRLRRFQYVDFTDKNFEDGVQSAKDLLRNLIDQPTLPRIDKPAGSEVLPAREQAAKSRTEEARFKEPEAAAGRDKPEVQPADPVKIEPPPAPARPRYGLMGVFGIGILVLLAAGYAITRIMGGGAAAEESTEPTVPAMEFFTSTAAAPIVPVTSDESPTPVPEEPTTTPEPTETLPPTEASTETPSGPLPELTDGKGVEMLLVPEGDFTMGSDRGLADEQPVHVVYLDSFYIDKYEVTNKFYQECVDAGECDPPWQTYFFAESPNRIYFGNSQYDNYPVVYVDWNMGRAYCAWRGARLPSEAEWEKAARGTEGNTYPWGQDLDCQKANYQSCVNRTIEVGSYEEGRSPYGVYDMTGNVWEWVADWYSANYYSNSPQNNPVGPITGQSKVLRGGAWPRFDVSAFHRANFAPTYNTFDIGFRCAMDATP
jgi:formylglycine-generating enzyme required for sulfatase activity